MKECIEDFKEAGLRVWMLTGDKGETAHQIAFSCGLYPMNDPSFLTIKLPDDGKLSSFLPQEGSKYGVTVGGSTLTKIIESPVQA